MKLVRLSLVAGLIGMVLPAGAATFNGNGHTGFGGPLGTGSLTLTDDGTTLFGTFTRGDGAHNDYLVIYFDSIAGGFSSTAGFDDQNDNHRRSISGVGWEGRSTLNFASGFLADYAVAIHNNEFTFGGLWGLAEGGGDSLNYLGSVELSGGGNAASDYTFSLSLASIGITPNSGAALNLVATYTAASGFRSNEAIGASDADPVNNVGLGTLTYTGFETYTTVPEPSTLSLVGLGLAGALFARSRRNRA